MIWLDDSHSGIIDIQMERSQVKQFKTSSSVFQSTLLGTHSLLALRPQSPSNDPHNIASRIAHLPADQRPDLTREPSMVLVFQAIEIERLSTEVQLLRGRLRERSDKVINAGSYEVQIRELVERCNKLQNEKFSYREQLTQTKDMSEVIFNELTQLKARYEEVDFSAAEKYKLEKARNQELAIEIEKWKNRYATLDRVKAEEAESTRRAIELQRESQLSNGSKELLLRFEIQREELLARLRQKKEELGEKDFQIKKLTNCFEQAQVRLQQQEHSIEQYEQKVAMLSQETYRLNELVRIKGQEIKSLKSNNEHDLTLKLSQLSSLDQTRNKLHSKLRSMQENNSELREALKTAENQSARLKIKASEAERLEFQLREARKETESKVKALERKDKKIILLEEEVKNLKQAEEQVASVRRASQELNHRVQQLQMQIDDKVQELRLIKVKYGALERQYQVHAARLSEKVSTYERTQRAFEESLSRLVSCQEEVSQKSSYFQLQVRQAAVNLKEKDYTISSLQQQLEKLEAKLRNREEQYSATTSRLQQEISRERQDFQRKVWEFENRKREVQGISRESEARTRELLSREKERDLRLKSMQVQSRELQGSNRRKQEEINELKQVISRLICFQDQLTRKQTDIAGEINTFQLRLCRIEEILSSLKGHLQERYRAAQEHQEHLKNTQIRVEDLHQWILRMADRTNQTSEYSPTLSPKKAGSDRNISPPKTRPFYSPEPIPTYAQSSSFFGLRGMDREAAKQANIGSSLSEIPVEWLLRFVLLCAQVQSLRKKVGDKQAKVQSMKSSIASKNNSNSTMINQLQSSGASTHSGFFTSRQSALHRKGNIYY